jgi:site-specific DNA recombinase
MLMSDRLRPSFRRSRHVGDEALDDAILEGETVIHEADDQAPDPLDELTVTEERKPAEIQHEPVASPNGVTLDQSPTTAMGTLMRAHFPRGGKAYGYVRASTVRQEISPEAQAEMIRHYCKHYGLELVDIVKDAGVSARIPFADRPGGSYLLQNVKKGEHIVIARLDRAFRRAADLAVHIQEFDRSGINLHIMDMGWGMDFSSPLGRFFAHVMAAVAELESSLISARTKEALAAAKPRGRNTGKFVGHAPYGWRYENFFNEDLGRYDVRRVPDNRERAIMREIVRLIKEEHLSALRIADILSIKKIPARMGDKWTQRAVMSMALRQTAIDFKEGKLTEKEAMRLAYKIAPRQQEDKLRFLVLEGAIMYTEKPMRFSVDVMMRKTLGRYSLDPLEAYRKRAAARLRAKGEQPKQS